MWLVAYWQPLPKFLLVVNLHQFPTKKTNLKQYHLTVFSFTVFKNKSIILIFVPLYKLFFSECFSYLSLVFSNLITCALVQICVFFCCVTWTSMGLWSLSHLGKLHYFWPVTFTPSLFLLSFLGSNLHNFRFIFSHSSLKLCSFRFFQFCFLCTLFWKWKWKSLSRVWLFATPWTIQSMEFSRSEYWSLQGIFPTQGSNPGLLHCRWILNQLSHKGSLRILPFPSPITVKVPVNFIISVISRYISLLPLAMDYIFFCFFACLIIFDWMVDIVIFTLLNKDFVVFLSSILLAHRKLLKEQCEHCEAYFFFFFPKGFFNG